MIPFGNPCPPPSAVSPAPGESEGTQRGMKGAVENLTEESARRTHSASPDPRRRRAPRRSPGPSVTTPAPRSWAWPQRGRQMGSPHEARSESKLCLPNSKSLSRREDPCNRQLQEEEDRVRTGQDSPPAKEAPSRTRKLRGCVPRPPQRRSGQVWLTMAQLGRVSRGRRWRARGGTHRGRGCSSGRTP